MMYFIDFLRSFYLLLFLLEKSFLFFFVWILFILFYFYWSLRKQQINRYFECINLTVVFYRGMCACVYKRVCVSECPYPCVAICQRRYHGNENRWSCVFSDIWLSNHITVSYPNKNGFKNTTVIVSICLSGFKTLVWFDCFKSAWMREWSHNYGSTLSHWNPRKPMSNINILTTL